MKYLKKFITESVSTQKDVENVLAKYKDIEYPKFKKDMSSKEVTPFSIKEEVTKFLLSLDKIQQEMHNLIMGINDKTDISDSLYDELEKSYETLSDKIEKYEDYSDNLEEYIKTQDRLNELYKILTK